MNEELKNQLEQAEKDALDLLSSLDVGTPEYRNAVESIEKLSKAIKEVDELSISKDLESRKFEDERKHRLINTITNVVTSVGRITVPVIMGILSFGLEKEGIMSFSAGKQAMRDCLDALKK